MEGWSSEAWATIIPAVLAAVAATTGAVLAGVNASRVHRFTRREQWWNRFSWALDKASSLDSRSYELGLVVVLALIDVPWATVEDNETARAIADAILPAGGGDPDV